MAKALWEDFNSFECHVNQVIFLLLKMKKLGQMLDLKEFKILMIFSIFSPEPAFYPFLINSFLSFQICTILIGISLLIVFLEKAALYPL